MKKSTGTALVFFVYIFISLFPTRYALAEEEFKIDIHGYISQGYLFSTGNNYLAETKKGTFQFNEMGIHFSAQVTDNLRIGIQLAARDLGESGNDRLKIDWAFADYRWQDWLGIRVGIVKMPLGFYNKTRDVDMLRTSILLPQAIYGETFRETTNSLKGVGAYGNIPLKALGSLSYQAMFGSFDVDKDGLTARRAESRGGIEVDKFDIGDTYCLALEWETPLEGLRIGAFHEKLSMKSHATLTEDVTIPVSFPPFQLTVAEKGDQVIMDTPSLKISVFSIEYTWKDLVLAAEYLRLDHLIITRLGGPNPPTRELDVGSFYGRAGYRFSKLFELGAYYSVLYRDRNDRDGTKTPYNPTFDAFQKDACLSLRFDLNDHWIFKLEGHLLNGTGLINKQDNLNELGELELKKNWTLFAFKMTFNF
jgi:hypothetical protein